ncbi:MAG: hypothetical protein PHY12_05765 [Eubacteriales bacterium]|nr:hypothetical protein [Eubacteriales bacterium]
MDSIAVLKLYRDARQTLDTYLARDLADRILGDMLRKYHMLLSDDELMSMIEVGEVEILNRPTTDSGNTDLDALWFQRLYHLAAHNAKAMAQIAEIRQRNDEHYYSGKPAKLMDWKLK